MDWMECAIQSFNLYLHLQSPVPSLANQAVKQSLLKYKEQVDTFRNR